MKTIGIIGASGQVGTEVSLFLKTYDDIKPIAVVRTDISGALLRRLGVEVRVGVLRDARQAAETLSDCDVIADFTLVSGSIAEVEALYREHIATTMKCSARHSKYVFASSINAFGMGGQHTRAKRYWLSHSVYAYTKRYAERLVNRLGRRSGKQVYIFRLGHVHGLLQRVSAEMNSLAESGCTGFEFPESPAHAVFCCSIAESLRNIAYDRERPGTYTLVADPPISWKDLIEHYAGRGTSVSLRPVTRSTWRRRLFGAVPGGLVRLASDNREALRAHILRHFPKLEQRAAASFRVSRARRQIAGFESLATYRPTGIHEGTFPGQRLANSLGASTVMEIKTEQVRAMVDSLSFNPEEAHNP